MQSAEVLFTPADFETLPARDLGRTTCVVFDVLRATTSMITALANGAKAIIPVAEIHEALALRRQRPDMLLAGERDGVRIRAAQSGGVDFDFGNSPREFTANRVRGKTIVTTTTNGTRALRACAGANIVLASSLLNLAATAKFLNQAQPAEIFLVCAGTGEGVALEDVLAAGALAGLLAGECSDTTEIAARTYVSARTELAAVLGGSLNARRLLAIPELRADVAFCSQRDVFNGVAEMRADGAIRRR